MEFTIICFLWWPAVSETRVGGLWTLLPLLFKWEKLIADRLVFLLVTEALCGGLKTITDAWDDLLFRWALADHLMPGVVDVGVGCCVQLAIGVHVLLSRFHGVVSDAHRSRYAYWALDFGTTGKIYSWALLCAPVHDGRDMLACLILRVKSQRLLLGFYSQVVLQWWHRMAYGISIKACIRSLSPDSL